ncbi:MAG: DUF4276 family protein [Fimbriiglobus sp.]
MSDTTAAVLVIEIFGEGKTDIGYSDSKPVPAMEGVVPVLTRRLCGDPPQLLVKRTPEHAFMHNKPRTKKVLFAKRQSRINGHAACVYVVDTEGKKEKVREELETGRAGESPEFPMAVGVAHPCIESWLLADASAIRRGFGLTGQRPVVPPEPEAIPLHDAQGNNQLKLRLAACHPNNRHPNLAEKSAIAEYLDLAVGEARCPSFAAFAVEVRTYVRDRFFPLPPEPTEPETAGKAIDDTSPA